MPKVPDYQLQPFGRVATTAKKPKPVVLPPSSKELRLADRLTELRKQLKALKREAAEVKHQLMLTRVARKRGGKSATINLYAPRLEDSCYYVGMSYNVDKRFIKHQTGKGASWTRLQSRWRLSSSGRRSAFYKTTRRSLKTT
jgi:hypothetical protein